MAIVVFGPVITVKKAETFTTNSQSFVPLQHIIVGAVSTKKVEIFPGCARVLTPSAGPSTLLATIQKVGAKLESGPLPENAVYKGTRCPLTYSLDH